MDWQALWLSVELALATLLVLTLPALALARWLARTRGAHKVWIEAAVLMPLVLPPTVLGFYLLVALGPHGPLGSLSESLGLGRLTFSFSGLLIGSLIYSLPFAVQPIQRAFEAIGARPMEAAATLRASPLDAFFSVALPLARPGLLTAAVLSFAHTLGEFGVVLMIGGNIPGQTQLISMLIYGHVEAMEYRQAHALAAAMLLFSFLVLVALNLLSRRQSRVAR